jgi:N-methylhydantoinase A/oxoprolinase/acetone carboxylase beta subunit
VAILGVDVGGTFTDAVLLDGAELPTVTDANLLLGRLPHLLAGGLELDPAAAERAFAGLDLAEAVEVVNAEMLRALRLVSVERGHDPREFALERPTEDLVRTEL